ncbi:hypothetical protein FIBSPDRAFT_809805 [Athelia psychrophila]|uniref:C4-dicarboxylate transporter/malic acid transport protein n=1 Tax=Athelia psychrophila TaxID=1759441 RepID=A0A166X761_9AGAM|nr:hypothetical protein FIBSPDRAFT_809805 [Fibularhizoctonia sp. CBS 109695]
MRIKAKGRGFDVVRDFSPAWFAVTMGTGAIAQLFQIFPYATEAQAFKILALLFFFLNLLLFILFSCITAARYILFPETWDILMDDPIQSLYTGTFPMGATTLINVSVVTLHGVYGFGGEPFLYTLWAFWWMNVVISCLCVWGILQIMITRQHHSHETMFTVWLLPVVTLVVASSTGNVLAAPMAHYSVSHALLTVTVSAFIVSIGLSLSLMVLTIYFFRLIIHGYPVGATIISSFLPLGPLAQAGYSILLFGDNFKTLLPLGYGQSDVLNAEATGDIIRVICLIGAFVLWSFATMWMLFALLGIQHAVRKSRFPFAVPFWGLIFPNGVYATLTLKLSTTLDSPFLRIYGAMYSTTTLLLWIWVATRTAMLLRNRHIFEAPCMEDVHQDQDSPLHDKI